MTEAATKPPAKPPATQPAATPLTLEQIVAKRKQLIEAINADEKALADVKSDLDKNKGNNDKATIDGIKNAQAAVEKKLKEDQAEKAAFEKALRDELNQAQTEYEAAYKADAAKTNPDTKKALDVARGKLEGVKARALAGGVDGTSTSASSGLMGWLSGLWDKLKDLPVLKWIAPIITGMLAFFLGESMGMGSIFAGMLAIGAAFILGPKVAEWIGGPSQTPATAANDKQPAPGQGQQQQVSLPQGPVPTVAVDRKGFLELFDNAPKNGQSQVYFQVAQARINPKDTTDNPANLDPKRVALYPVPLNRDVSKLSGVVREEDILEAFKKKKADGKPEVIELSVRGIVPADAPVLAVEAGLRQVAAAATAAAKPAVVMGTTTTATAIPAGKPVSGVAMTAFKYPGEVSYINP